MVSAGLVQAQGISFSPHCGYACDALLIAPNCFQHTRTISDTGYCLGGIRQAQEETDWP
jgi:hypothetical protein